jgi:predicted ArsR family transcriptional regulator
MPGKKPKASSDVAKADDGKSPDVKDHWPRWTFLTNHAHVLILIAQDSTMVLRDVAARVGITERAVQRIVADLEEEGFLEREKVGRQNRYRISAKQALRHPIETHRSIGDLIQLITNR